MKIKLLAVALNLSLLISFAGCAVNIPPYQFYWYEPEFAVKIVGYGINEDGKREIMACGSGFVFNGKEGLVATVAHVIDISKKRDSKRNKYDLKIILNGKEYATHCVWRHTKLDIGLLKIDTLEEIKFTQLKISGNIPPTGTCCRLIGYQPIGRLIDGSLHYRFVPVDSYKPFFFDKSVIIGGVAEGSGRLIMYNGLSGSVLLDNRNEAVALFSFVPYFSPNHLYFVSLNVIPKKFWPDVNGN
jgi:hypothetical protein